MQKDKGKSGVPHYGLCALLILITCFVAMSCGGGGEWENQTSRATIEGVIPEHGPSAGGMQCTVTGDNFNPEGETGVYFGKQPAADIVVVDSYTITCTVPAGSAGLTDVSVGNTLDGVTTLPDAFTYHDPPVIEGIEPDSGTIMGGTLVTITGSNFTKVGDTHVTFGGVQAGDVTVIDDNTIRCVALENGAGSVDVCVSNDFGSDILEDGFYYYFPITVESLTPDEGHVSGGALVVITGSNFTSSEDTTVLFGLEEALDVVVVNETTITCETPPHTAAAVDVIVQCSRGNFRLEEGFTYHNITAIEPDSGLVSGGTRLTIYGSDFTTREDTTVTIGGEPALDIVIIDPETMRCTTPAVASPGPVDVYVANSIGYDTVVDGFTYGTLPVVSDVTPGHGTTGGGLLVTISGSDFTETADTTVAFDGVAAANVNVVDETTITCRTPAHAAGSVDVVVDNGFGPGTLPDGFTYHNAPSVQGVAPNSGWVTGGEAVTITGSDFASPSTTVVTFGGAEATNVVIVDATTITCTTPAHGAGTVDVAVSNAFGSDTLNGGFTYMALPDPPEITGLAPEHGASAGGTLVTISGSGFTSTPDTTVTFGGNAAIDVTVVNAATITCTTPAHAAGIVSVAVSNSNGSDVLPNSFTYHDAPVISAVAPDNGPPEGGTPVTVTGANFTDIGLTRVMFGNNYASDVTVVSSTKITCTTPAHATGAVNVTVTNFFGSDILAGGFTYNEGPSISGVNHEHGPVAGGTFVTISGVGFTSTPDTTVTFDGIDALDMSVVNATTITCKTPAHSAGSVDVTVTNSNGSDTLPNGFTYHNAPSIQDLSPDNGPVAGGTLVTINGADFTAEGTTTVSFGGAGAADVVVVDATTITCTTPVHASGSVDVEVANDFGSDTLAGGFTYNVEPKIDGIAPDQCGVDGGAAVTITGSGFTSTADTTVTFGGTAALDIAVVDATTITCTTPAHAAGSVDVTVSNSNGSDTLVDGFIYNEGPSVTGINHENGGVAGGTPVTITGSGFTSTPDTTVTFGGTDALDIVVVDEATVTCTTPAHASGSVDVTVSNSNGSGTLPNGFTYHDAPDIIAVAPDNGPLAGGTFVTVKGTDFTDLGTTSVTFDGITATNVAVVDATTITCTTPAHPAGAVDVAVANDFGSDTLVDGYTYNNEPAIGAVTPDHSGTGGTAVTITGSNFTSTPDTSVTFDGIGALDIVVVNATTITCTTPAHAAGSVDVTVSNSNGSDTLPNGFTYFNAPSIQSVSPDNGPEAGGTSVTIKGSDFSTEGTTSVTFDGIAAANVAVVNATTITCTTPAHAAGSVDVAVANEFGSDTLVDGYTYNAAPSIDGVSPKHSGVDGGLQVTITGSGFTSTADTSVTFGGADALDIAVVNATTITCTTPAHAAGSVDLTVTNSNGSDTLPNGFTYHEAPSIQDVNPDNGTIAGGTAVTVRGTDFTTVGTTTVTFDGIEAGNVTVVNATTITCTTPAHVAGSVDVTVSNPFGADTLTDGFTYVGQVNIDGVAPATGVAEGGTSVTITGEGFTSAPDTTVTFGGIEANDVVVVDAEKMTCTTPAHAAGGVDVAVSNSNGTDVLANGFTYIAAPEVYSVTPNIGNPTGGLAVAITGANFTPGASATVTFGGETATNVDVVSTTVITCFTPAHAVGSVDVTVTDDNGTGTLPDGFEYVDPPEITEVTPEHGGIAGGTYVAITGSGFTSTGDTTVTFAGLNAVNVAVVDPATIVCQTPANQAGTVDVSVRNSNGLAVLPGGFTYHNAPEVQGVSPDSGSPDGGTAVTITGTDFSAIGDTTVRFGSAAAANVVVVSSTTITCVTPAHAAGTVDVTVANEFGSDTLFGGYTYNSAPAISNLAPEFGASAGGTSVTITGTGFTTAGDTTVTFGGTPAFNVSVPDSETIVCETPAHAAGTVDVTVSNSNGSDTLGNGFTFVDPPQIGSLAPDSGPSTGGTTVTITGSNFTTAGTTAVKFGAVSGSNVNVVSSTSITCVTPAHGSGTVDVTVTNDFGEDTLPGGFTFSGPPTISGVTPAQGSTDGGTAVTISGGGFTDTSDTDVTFGGVDATDIFVVDSTTITCTTPPHAEGSVDVTVSNSNGSDTLVDGFTYQGPASINTLTYIQNGNTVTLNWSLSGTADEIVIFRGAVPVASISGSATSYILSENDFGYYRYTVGLMVDGIRVDEAFVLVHLGKIVWDYPGCTCTGFYLYVAEAIGDPYTTLPYNDPMNFSCDVGYCCEVSLQVLYDEALIEGGKSYYLAASSYLGNPCTDVSELTDPLTFAYEVVIESP